MKKFGLAHLVALMIVVAVVVTIVKWLLITAAILVVPFGAWFFYDRVSTAKRRTAAERAAANAAERRREVESRAVFDAAGGCGWCGQRSMHLDARGGVMHPAAFHRAEIEETIAATPR
ncbi:hypothetical protein GCM10010472_54250 [Pseudonocardia halophobica]|uniref:Uncharacterized protein n=1 Tax=Pseudonocardia halophobica TaxID=29401 RepID=A0A9W6NW41_9PSEU|nr:hypothetical protein [Pseudonocardia halophobica]GLL11504.1 hypothetical protein GCM10017577_26450 [Pseudonocardia halophobica]